MDPLLQVGLERSQVVELDIKDVATVACAQVVLYGKPGSVGLNGLQDRKQVVLLGPPTWCPIRQIAGRHGDRPARR